MFCDNAEELQQSVPVDGSRCPVGVAAECKTEIRFAAAGDLVECVLIPFGQYFYWLTTQRERGVHSPLRKQSELEVSWLFCLTLPAGWVRRRRYGDRDKRLSLSLLGLFLRSCCTPGRAEWKALGLTHPWGKYSYPAGSYFPSNSDCGLYASQLVTGRACNRTNHF